ncbi:hypothetical protein [Flavobacterium cerinum]|uniref:Uncharacterized protein n=1 Tax=Flavobacterium cerinum TaxID=2502784 RepID=A0A444H8Z0_9FLAO|nr:hypothetical protein [Flavobacterium cerinum]RWW99686.1 hypothetical protein EPI11_12095 [Flavobacterium cerinum]
MRNKGIIAKEIVELSEIRSAYNHYLGSHRGLTEVENTTQVQHNKKIITAALRVLYVELEQSGKAVSALKAQPAIKTVEYSALERNAILHFNRDKRFTITE